MKPHLGLISCVFGWAGLCAVLLVDLVSPMALPAPFVIPSVDLSAWFVEVLFEIHPGQIPEENATPVGSSAGPAEKCCPAVGYFGQRSRPQASWAICRCEAAGTSLQLDLWTPPDCTACFSDHIWPLAQCRGRTSLEERTSA